MMEPVIFKGIFLALEKDSRMNTQLQFQSIVWLTVLICVFRRFLGVLTASGKVLILPWMSYNL